MDHSSVYTPVWLVMIRFTKSSTDSFILRWCSFSETCFKWRGAFSLSGSSVFVLVGCWSMIPFPWLLTPMLLRHSVRKTWTSLLLLLMILHSFINLRLNESLFQNIFGLQRSSNSTTDQLRVDLSTSKRLLVVCVRVYMQSLCTFYSNEWTDIYNYDLYDTARF